MIDVKGAARIESDQAEMALRQGLLNASSPADRRQEPLAPRLNVNLKMIKLLEDVLVDLIGMSVTARNPAAKKLLALRVRQIREALADASA